MILRAGHCGYPPAQKQAKRLFHLLFFCVAPCSSQHSRKIAKEAELESAFEEVSSVTCDLGCRPIVANSLIPESITLKVKKCKVKKM